MKFYKINEENAKQVTQYNSNFLMNSFMHLNCELRISVMTLGENGIIGFHQTTTPQLLYLLEGEGVVCNEEKKYYSIQKGIAVFWNAGEWHETKSKQGLVALIIEGFNINEESILLDTLSNEALHCRD
jgi:quercetin dioxygenase-like cupin family protein